MMSYTYRDFCDGSGPGTCPGSKFVLTCEGCSEDRRGGGPLIRFGKTWDHDRTLREREHGAIQEYREAHGGSTHGLERA